MEKKRRQRRVKYDVRGGGADQRIGEAAAPAYATDLPANAQGRVGWMAETFGSNSVADMLSVSRSQPSRWRSGIESPGPESQRRLLDLDYVMARLMQIMTPDLALDWLYSQNAHLGARPIDVMRLRGAAAVIDAVDAEEEGAYA
ncbi:MAG: antitoxin Xre/MbcA/ParS toxin-binding domain-containing protein [Dehalococcoidia bacterium]